MPAPPMRWRGHDSHASSADASDWSESESESDESATSTASRVDDIELSSDAISATARRVLADLEPFFDHELFASDCEDDDSDSDGGNQSNGGSGAISLDELSIVLNASIQRHRPAIAAAAASSTPIPAVVLDPSKTTPTRTLQSRLRPSTRHRQLHRSAQQLPFAHFLDLREQKTQLFRAECREARQRSKRQSNNAQSPERGRWSVDSDASSTTALSFNDDDQSKRQSTASDNRASIASSGATKICPRERYTSQSVRSTSGSDMPRSLNARDALTQGTLMCDQSQQTDAPKRQAAESWASSPSASRAQSASHSGSFQAFESDDEVKDDDHNSVGKANNKRAEQARRHQSWAALSVHSLAHSSPRSSSGSSRSSSTSERSDSEIERVAQIHHDCSRHRRDESRDCHRPHSAALPQEQPQAAPAPRQEVALARTKERTVSSFTRLTNSFLTSSLVSLSTHVHSLCL